jgi:hypothetical protein
MRAYRPHPALLLPLFLVGCQETGTDPREEGTGQSADVAQRISLADSGSGGQTAHFHFVCERRLLVGSFRFLHRMHRATSSPLVSELSGSAAAHTDRSSLDTPCLSAMSLSVLI